jgi:hypothetical protein
LQQSCSLCWAICYLGASWWWDKPSIQELRELVLQQPSLLTCLHSNMLSSAGHLHKWFQFCWECLVEKCVYMLQKCRLVERTSTFFLSAARISFDLFSLFLHIIFKILNEQLQLKKMNCWVTLGGKETCYLSIINYTNCCFAKVSWVCLYKIFGLSIYVTFQFPVCIFYHTPGCCFQMMVTSRLTLRLSSRWKRMFLSLWKKALS